MNLRDLRMEDAAALAGLPARKPVDVGPYVHPEPMTPDRASNFNDAVRDMDRAELVDCLFAACLRAAEARGTTVLSEIWDARQTGCRVDRRIRWLSDRLRLRRVK